MEEVAGKLVVDDSASMDALGGKAIWGAIATLLVKGNGEVRRAEILKTWLSLLKIDCFAFTKGNAVACARGCRVGDEDMAACGQLKGESVLQTVL